jgi:hypothetical protein
MKSAGHIGEIDMRHHRSVIPEAVQAEALAHVAVDRQTHVRPLPGWLHGMSQDFSIHSLVQMK